MKKLFLIMLAVSTCLAACKEEEQTVATSVELVSVTPGSLALEEGDSYTLTATVSPETAVDKSVRWTTADASKVIVNSETGEVTALAIGSAIITATAKENGRKGHCTITVTEKIFHVESVAILPTLTITGKGEAATLTVTVLPDNATDPTVTWSSSDENIATVDSDGVVTAVNGGAATITVTSNDGAKTADCVVTVIVPVTSVSVLPTTTTIGLDATPPTVQLAATVLPDDATDKTVTWSSSHNNFATVDNEGLVTAQAEGAATITVTTNDGSYTATCVITVSAAYKPVIDITLDNTTHTLWASETVTLAATVQPADANNPALTWETSDAAVATVDNSGKVTALKPGAATITARSVDNTGISATCGLTVKAYMLYVEGRNSSNNRNDTYIDFGIHPEYNGNSSGGPVTIEFWGKYTAPISSNGLPTLIGTHQEIDGAHRGWFLNVIGGQRLRISVGTSTGLHEPGGDNLVTSLPMSDWHHYAFVYNTDGNGAFALYVDGALIEAHSGADGVMYIEPQQMTAFINPLRWGDRSITGWMRKLRVWNTAKTQEELNTLKNTDVIGSESDLVAAWDFTAKPASNSNIPSIKNGGSFKATINGTENSTFRWEKE
jgi:uncharacterized protein YjdB